MTAARRSPMQASALPPTSESPPFYCRIDHSDCILELGGTAAEASSSATDAALIGTSLYAHVSGHFTRRFLQSFVAQARATGAQSRRIYRCDSPQSRRLMEMRAMPENDGRVRLEHRLLEQSDFDFPVELATATRRGLAHYLRCSNCCKLRPIRAGDWLEPEDYAARGSTAQVVHTICPTCQGGGAVQRLVLRPKS